MRPTEQTKLHVIANYVEPARKKGEKTIQVRVGNVQRELGWTNRTPSVFSTLSSREFQQEAGVKLVKKIGGPASGGPSTTVQFVYHVLGANHTAEAANDESPRRNALRDLYGICAETFKALGGGEEFLRREREWGPDAWERYESEKLAQEKAEAAR
jgi:hypothetical protein